MQSNLIKLAFSDITAAIFDSRDHGIGPTLSESDRKRKLRYLAVYCVRLFVLDVCPGKYNRGRVSRVFECQSIAEINATITLIITIIIRHYCHEIHLSYITSEFRFFGY